MEKVISYFLKYLGIPISTSYCEDLITSHSDYPSLLSISDTLARLGIPCVMGKIEMAELMNTPFPYLLHINKKYGEILMVKDNLDLKKNESDLKYWDGIVMLIDSSQGIKDKAASNSYEKSMFYKAVLYILIVGVSMFLILPIAFNFNSASFSSFIISIIGFIAAYLIVAKELGIKYKMVEDFCATGENGGCGQVLLSKGATLWREIKLIDAAVVYFGTQLIFLSLAALESDYSLWIYNSLAISSFLLIPVVVYSIFYQYFIVKTWCRLCLSIDAVLTAQALLWSYLYFPKNFSDVSIVIKLLLFESVSFVILGCIFLLFKEMIERYNRVNKFYRETSRVKNSADVFLHLLKQQNKVIVSNLNNDVIIGKKGALITVTMVSNLYCDPCKDQHKVIEYLVKMFPNEICVNFKFVKSKDSSLFPNSNQYLIQYWLDHIHNKKNESEITQELIHRWYEYKDLKKFTEIFQFNYTPSFEIAKKIDHLNLDWISQAMIIGTPTFFINGYQIPKNYQINDLIWLLPSLVDLLKRN